ncbi:MAG: UPF0147 family protein [Nanoarchaeota archaeon]|nr:UPF0147 family protein [DPANN group archaeon]MBL7116815.1 UPF0147 family protein [Nanoarchaeota archaeon]
MEIKNVIDALNQLEEDTSVPKNIKQRISEITSDMKSDKDLSLKVNKSLSELDDIANDINLPTFVRTQIWGIASMLEKLNNSS